MKTRHPLKQQQHGSIGSEHLATLSQQQKLEDDQKLNVLINFEIISEADTSDTYQTAITLLEKQLFETVGTIDSDHWLK